MNLWPFRRKGQVIKPDTGVGIVPDVDQLVGDEVMDLGGGMFVRVADLVCSLDNGGDVPVHRCGGDPT